MSQAGKTDKVAQGYRTPQWEKSKLWANLEKKANPEIKEKEKGNE